MVLRPDWCVKKLTHAVDELQEWSVKKLTICGAALRVALATIPESRSDGLHIFNRDATREASCSPRPRTRGRGVGGEGRSWAWSKLPFRLASYRAEVLRLPRV